MVVVRFVVGLSVAIWRWSYGLSASGLDATVRRARALRPVWGPVAMR